MARFTHFREAPWERSFFGSAGDHRGTTWLRRVRYATRDAGRAQRGWYPRLVDYLYVSFTNSLAFSPTDAMPLTRLLKLAMLSEASISSITVLLVAARAINILD